MTAKERVRIAMKVRIARRRLEMVEQRLDGPNRSTVEFLRDCQSDLEDVERIIAVAAQELAD